jgi:DNA-directed RNA polymerase sigma subunit (sigma70/sigma32)
MSDSTRPRSFNPPEHERFVKRYIRLPLKTAIEFTESGVPLLDLLDAGNVALMHAAGEFEPFLGESFEEFADGKIREAMRRRVERGGCEERGNGGA